MLPPYLIPVGIDWLRLPSLGTPWTSAFNGRLELLTLVRMRPMRDGVTIESFSFEDVNSSLPEAQWN